MPSTSKPLLGGSVKPGCSEKLKTSSTKKLIVKRPVSPSHSDLEEFAEEATVDVMDIRIRDVCPFTNILLLFES